MPLDIHDLINAHLELATGAPNMSPDEWVSTALDLLLRVQHRLEQSEFAELNGLIVLAAKEFYLSMMDEAARQVDSISVTDAIIAKMKGGN